MLLSHVDKCQAREIVRIFVTANFINIGNSDFIRNLDAIVSIVITFLAVDLAEIERFNARTVFVSSRKFSRNVVDSWLSAASSNKKGQGRC